VASFRNPSFGRIVDAALKQTAAALRDADVPFCLIGSLAVWARGGPESSHDLDFGVREQDLLACAEALEAVGMTIEIPPEDWLVKAWLGEPGAADSVLVDLIYGASGLEITDEVLGRADVLDVLAHRMPVMTATDILTTKLLSLREQHLDYTATIATARAVREQVDWEAVRERCSPSPYARAFFTMAEGLGICPPLDGHAMDTPVEALAGLQAIHEACDRPYRRELAERLARRGGTTPAAPVA
jgi:hypothetical protein